MKYTKPILTLCTCLTLALGPLAANDLWADKASAPHSLTDLDRAARNSLAALPPDQVLGLVNRHIELACQRSRLGMYGVDGNLLRALINQESGWKWWARSPKGATGLCQFMRGTGARFGLVDEAQGIDRRMDPVASVYACADYLKLLLDLFGGNVALALAGYNAGENRVIRAGYRIPAIPETQQYVACILAGWRRSGSRAAQMVTLNFGVPASSVATPTAPGAALMAFPGGQGETRPARTGSRRQARQQAAQAAAQAAWQEAARKQQERQALALAAIEAQASQPMVIRVRQ